MWAGFAWLRIGTSEELFEDDNKLSGCPLKAGNFLTNAAPRSYVICGLFYGTSRAAGDV
jgi:hypothetical protein